MSRAQKPRALALTAITVAALSLSACGSNSLSGTPSTSSAPTQSQSVDQSLFDKLPDNIKSSKTITIGTDPTYAPNEFLKGDGKTIQGADIDLFNAVAAKLGVKAQYESSTFDTIIVGVQSGKYDIGVSSFTINADREKQVNMVSYLDRRHPMGHPGRQPGQHQPRRCLRQDGGRPEGHRAGHRRPARPAEEVRQ